MVSAIVNTPGGWGYNHVVHSSPTKPLLQPTKAMIKIASSARLSFMFPADRVTAYDYYSDMRRLVSHLKHINLIDIDTESPYEFRLYYNTVELSAYHIHVYADVRLDLVSGHHIIRLSPIENLPAIETNITFNATTTRGYFSSEAYFYDAGDETRIDYTLKLQATPPRPMGMRFMPQRVVDTIAQNITNTRMKEIAEGFIESSISAFPAWLGMAS